MVPTSLAYRIRAGTKVFQLVVPNQVKSDEPPLAGLVLTQNSNAPPAMWLEGRFARLPIRFAAFQAGSSSKKGALRYRGEVGKRFG